MTDYLTKLLSAGITPPDYTLPDFTPIVAAVEAAIEEQHLSMEAMVDAAIVERERVLAQLEPYLGMGWWL
jgi:hypothetical protein